MLNLALISALTATASVPAKPWTCDLAPSYGTGSADEGRVNQFSALNFACRYALIEYAGFTVSPSLGLDRQLWSVRSSEGQRKDLSTFETTDFVYGLRVDHDLVRHLKAFYGIAAAQGKGSLAQTYSTDTVSLSRDFSSVDNRQMQHTLGLAYAFSASLSMSFAWQRLSGDQEWSLEDASQTLQEGTPEGFLSLTEGADTLALTGRAEKTSDSHTSNLFQIGVSLSFGER